MSGEDTNRAVQQALIYASVAPTFDNIAAVRQGLRAFGVEETQDHTILKIVIGKLEFKQPPRRAIGRNIDKDELVQMFQKIMAANPWLADTRRNGDLITKVFFEDPRINSAMTLKDLVEAVRIADAEHRLDKVPPPPKPIFDDEPMSRVLSDGSSPLPLSTSLQMMRASPQISAIQVRDWNLRNEKYRVWKQEHPDA